MIIARPEWFRKKKVWWMGCQHQNMAGSPLPCLNNHANTPDSAPTLEAIARLYVTGAWLLFVFIDMFDVMWKVQRDEREYIHEAIAERNAAWAMMPILVVGMFIELILEAPLEENPGLTPSLPSTIAGVVAKSVTNYRLEKEN